MSRDPGRTSSEKGMDACDGRAGGMKRSALENANGKFEESSRRLL